MKSHVRCAWLTALLVWVLASACECGGGVVVKLDGGADSGPTRCQNDAECQAQLGDRWYCDQSDGTCKLGPRYCDEGGDAACCPGQTCNRGGICVDDYEVCTEDADCSVAGQRCLPRTVNGSEQQVCTFARCDADGSCPDGLDCFAGYCVGEPPCGGGCPPGQACVPSNNSCHPTDLCEQSCPAGTIATFSDPDNVDDTCDPASLACHCEPLPPLEIVDIGRHSGLAVLRDGSAAVSALEGDHEDLVVVFFDASGARSGVEWVDGLPQGGIPVADPAGPRGGIDEPGPAVGRFTDIVAAGDGTLHVSYYDRDNGDLKYARRAGDGSWSTHTVDAAGDVGWFTSITLTPAGEPLIAYFSRAGEGADTYVSALKLAQASSAAPTSASDWTVFEVERKAVPPPPCGGSCPTGEQCADAGRGPECLPDSNGCATPCATGDVCVDDGGNPLCATQVPLESLEDLPEGTGLFPEVDASAAGVAVAWYDRSDGALKVATGVDVAGGTVGSVVTLGSGPEQDLGRFPSLARTSGGYLVVYEDAGADALKWALVENGAVSAEGVVDDGLRDPAGNGPSLVGADAKVLVDGNRWLVVYQDATAGDLLYATADAGGAFSRQVVYSEGAAGFWADAVLHQGTLYISHAVLQGARNGPIHTELRLERLTP